MNLADNVYSHFPWWIGWIQPFVYVPLAVATSLLACWLGARIGLRPFRLLADQSWAQQVQFAHVARVIAWCNVWVCGCVGATFFALLHGDFSRLPTLMWGVLGLASGLTGSLAILSRVQRLIGERRSVLRQIADTLAYVVLLGGVPVIVLLVTGLSLPRDFNLATILALAAAAGFVLFWNLGGHWFVLNLSPLLRPASPRAKEITERASRTVGSRPRTIVEIRVKHANAFAFPVQQAIGFTQGILDGLDDDQLVAICAHELGHLGDRRRYQLLNWINVGFLFLCLPLVALKPLVGTFGTSWLPLLVFVYPAMFLVARIVAMRIRRAGEVHADAVGSQNSDYARALEHLYRVNLMPVNQKSYLGHPALYDRLIAAGAAPEYPRPKRASRVRFVRAMVAETGLLIVLMFGWLVIQSITFNATESSNRASLTRLAMMGGSANEIFYLGIAYFEEGSHDRAIALMRLASFRRPDTAWLPAHLAMRLVELQRCDEAKHALLEAERRLKHNPDAFDMNRQNVEIAKDFIIARCDNAERESELE